MRLSICPADFPGFVLTSKFTTFFYVFIKSTALAIVRKRHRIINDGLVLSQAATETGQALPAVRGRSWRR